MSVTSLVAPDVVFLAAVRALPPELLEALQNAELCEPQASQKRFFRKKQSLHSADQTFRSLPAGKDTFIPGIGLSYISYSPPLYLHRLSRLSLLVSSSVVVFRSVMKRSRLTGRRQLRAVTNCRRITARRLLRGTKRCDIGQRTPRVQVDRAISLGLIMSVVRGKARWKGVLKGECVVDSQGMMETEQELMTVNAGKRKKAKLVNSSAKKKA